MNTKLICFLAVAIMTSVTSCQKDFTPSDDLIQNPTSLTDSNYLDKIYELIPNGATFDTDAIYYFKYDAQKRVTAVHDSVKEGGLLRHWQTCYYFYNGTDTIPYKNMDVSTEAVQYADTTTTFSFFNTNLQKIKDSVINSNYTSGLQNSKGVIVYHYILNPAVIYTNSAGYDIYNFLTQQYTLTGADTSITDNSGNITSLKGITYIVSPSPNSSSFYTTDISTTLNNRPNPLAKLNLYKALYYGQNSFYFPLPFSKNNPVQTLHAGFPSIPTSYSYQYNSAGYPAVCNQVSNGDTLRYLFRYKSL